MKFILFAVFLFVCSVSYGQKLPWSDAPDSSIVEAPGEALKVYLKVDTLGHRRSFSTWPDPDPANYWTSDTNKIVGYGYLTKDGKPLSIWKYYIRKNDEYQLFCEGYYLKADTSNVVAQKEQQTKFADVRMAALEVAHDKLLHCNEWRFYKDGKMTTRLLLSNKARLNLMPLSSFDSNGIESAPKYVLAEEWRLIGDLLIEEMYYPNGKLKAVKGKHGYQIGFTEDGESQLPEMREMLHMWSPDDWAD
jgi:hypothetical protein